MATVHVGYAILLGENMPNFTTYVVSIQVARKLHNKQSHVKPSIRKLFGLKQNWKKRWTWTLA